MRDFIQLVFLALIVGALMLLVARITGMFEGTARNILRG